MSAEDLDSIDDLNAEITTVATEMENTTLSTEQKINILAGSMDSFFLIVMGMVVFLMQCGFAFLEAGAVRYDYILCIAVLV